MALIGLVDIHQQLHVANSAIVTRTGNSSSQSGERTCRSILLLNCRLPAHPKPATEQCAHMVRSVMSHRHKWPPGSTTSEPGSSAC